MKKKWLIGLLVALTVLLSISYASAQMQIKTLDSLSPVEVEFKITPIKDKVYGNQWAEFEIDILNKHRGSRDLKMYFDEGGISWAFFVDPATYQINGFQTNSDNYTGLKVSFKPKLEFPRSNKHPQNVPLRFVDVNSGEQFFVQLRVFLMEDPLSGSAVNSSVIVDDKLDPKEMHPLKIIVGNNRVTHINDMKIVVSSKLFNSDTTVSLKPYQEKEVGFNISYDPMHPYAKDTLIIRGVDKHDVLFEIEKEIEVVSKTVPYDQTSRLINGVLKARDIITLTNNENVEETQKVLIPLGSLWFLTSADVSGEYEKIKGERYYSIQEYSIGSRESEDITLTTNYVPVYIIIILLIISAFLYHMFKSPMIIRKDAEPYEESQGVTGIKVVLTIKNLTSKNIRNITIVDLVPKIATVSKEHFAGTISPSKVLATELGHVIHWDLDELEPKEERIITYQILSKLTLVNGIRLPPARAQVKIDTHHVSIKSNELDVSSSKKSVKDEY